ncbi:DUF418 domain-containing protein [Paenibacillus sp. CF384]|uniref:DUF418 domain-containing protein n=1 Tax=Paenibacillus sp. CF384 TaxID=1884382 RepID=UPI000898C750|nr:DUF418 domain-containing protein [Paenibacillus sp. CF384]SDW03168.1 Uncharacterized membrane protein YeiB [Paenibacillus sp. CF384]
MINHSKDYQPPSFSKRKLAPDLVRGVMLLLIALAHANQNLLNNEATLLNQLIVFLRQIFVDGRAFPVFFLLFGYGMVQLLRAQETKEHEWPFIRKLFRRRGWWLLLFGFVHALSLVDFTIGLYGMAMILFCWFLRLSNKKLVWIAATTLLLATILGSEITRGEYDWNQAQPTSQVVASAGILEAMLTRAFTWAFYSVILLHQVIPAMAFGIWAGRKMLLDHPEQHRKLLMWSAAVGLALSTLGGIPLALMSSLVWESPSYLARAVAGSLHNITGYAGGVGWAALIGLICVYPSVIRSKLTMAIAALGQRSLTFYIFQSIVFFIVFTEGVGGLGAVANQLSSDLVAWLTWIISILLAMFMQRANYAGPAEKLLRRLSYVKSRT